MLSVQFLSTETTLNLSRTFVNIRVVTQHHSVVCAAHSKKSKCQQIVRFIIAISYYNLADHKFYKKLFWLRNHKLWSKKKTNFSALQY